MRKLTITDPARSDLQDIRQYTGKHYGRSGADAYDALLKQAIRDIRENPSRPGSQVRPELGHNIRSYHTTLSRHRAGRRIKAPRHFILYFLPHDNEVVISRVLHDSRHIPGDHLEQARSLVVRNEDEGKATPKR